MNELIACTGEGVEVSSVPSEIKILPFGRVNSQKGDFNVDDESVELIKKQFKSRRLDLVIDYEHQTLSDIQAPAAGWIKDIYKGDNAIIAKVEWTTKAKEYLKNKEYRYLSPVVIVRKKDQKAIAIHSVALTNTPAIDGMYAIVNSAKIADSLEGENNMNIKEIAKALGLPETATEEEIKQAIEDSRKAIEKLKVIEQKGEDGDITNEGTDNTKMVANSTILSLLDLNENAKTEDVTASIMALKAGGMNIQQEILALKQKVEQKEADEAVNVAMKEGKITAAQCEWAKAYALKDPEGFRKFTEKAVPVVPQGKLQLKDAPDTVRNHEVDIAILKNCGINPEDVKQYFSEED